MTGIQANRSTLCLRDLPEGDLIARIREGDREAGAEFMRRHRRLIAHRHRWRLGGQAHDLADTDDLLSTVARRFDRFIATAEVQASRAAKLVAVLHQIAAAAGTEAARRAHRVRARERRAAVEPSVPAGVGVAEERRVPPWGGSLDEVSREVVELRLRGLTHGHIAEAMGLTHQQVRQRFSRAMAAIRARA